MQETNKKFLTDEEKIKKKDANNFLWIMLTIFSRSLKDLRIHNNNDITAENRKIVNHSQLSVREMRRRSPCSLCVNNNKKNIINAIEVLKRAFILGE